MKTILAAAGPAHVLLVPTGAIAKPDRSEVDAAKAQCKAERVLNAEAFKTTYGTNKNDKNVFGKCVSSKARGGS
jgi:hypothetical protein